MSQQQPHAQPQPRLATMAEELASLGQRLTAISAELQAIQAAQTAQPGWAAQAGQPGTAAATPRPAWTPPPVAPPYPGYHQPVPGYQQMPPPPGPPPPPYRPVPTRPGLLDREGAGGRLLAWIGGVVTLLGVVLMMVLAVQRGWLGPFPRVLVGAVLGFAMIGLAVRVYRLPGGRIGGLALAATGTAALYLDVIAATELYEYLPVAGGLVVGIAVAAGGLLFADRWRAELLAVTAVAGAAAFAPVLVRPTGWPLVGFLLVLQATAAPVQLRQRWSGLAAAAGLPPVLAGTFYVAWQVSDRPGAAVAVAVAVLVVGAAVAVVGGQLMPDQPISPGLLALSATPAVVVAPGLSRWPGTELLAVVAIAFAALWASRWLTAGTLSPWLRAVAGVVAVATGFEATLLAFDGAGMVTALLTEAAVLAMVAWQVRIRGMLLASTLLSTAGGLLALIIVVPPTALVRFPAEPFLDGGARQTTALVAAFGVGALLMAGATAHAMAASRFGWLRAGAEYLPLWLVAIGVGLYGEVAAVLGVTLLAWPTEAGFLTGHAVVTVSWTVAALALLVRGIRSRPLRATGMGLVGAALVKLVLFDLANLDGIARVATFLVAGLVLLAAGVRYARLVATVDEQREP